MMPDRSYCRGRSAFKTFVHRAKYSDMQRTASAMETFNAICAELNLSFPEAFTTAIPLGCLMFRAPFD